MTLYLNDIVILTADFTQTMDRLKTVLILASEYGLEFNMKKCKFMKTYRIFRSGYREWVSIAVSRENKSCDAISRANFDEADSKFSWSNGILP